MHRVKDECSQLFGHRACSRVLRERVRSSTDGLRSGACLQSPVSLTETDEEKRMFTRLFFLLAAARLVPEASSAVVVDLSPSQDNTIFQDSGTLSNGAGSWIFAGKNNDG